MRKPWWKCAVEIAVGLAFLAIGGAWVADAVSGAPSWHWLGLISIVYGGQLISSNWREL